MSSKRSHQSGLQVDEIDTSHRDHDSHSSGGGGGGPGVLETIRRLQDGSLQPSSLSKEDRRLCVQHLMGEGYGAPETAEILKVNERTIYRDRDAVREANAIERDPRMAAQFVGRLVYEAELAIGRIRRAARSRDTDPATKIDGERSCWVIMSDLSKRLQSLGYLPTAAQEIRAELTHRVDGPPDYGEIEAEMERLAAIAAQTGGGSDDVVQQLEMLSIELSRARLATAVDTVAHQIESGDQADADDAER